jgi:hypothetical protein
MNHTTPTTKRRLRRAALIAAPLSGLALAAALVGTASSASALDAPYPDYDNLTLSTVSASYADSTVVTVSGSGITPGDYELGECEYTSYDTTVAPGVTAPIPACGTTTVAVTVPASGSFSVSFTLLASDTNAHYPISHTDQPPLLDLSANLGELDLIPLHASGTPTPVADSAEFNVF